MALFHRVVDKFIEKVHTHNDKDAEKEKDKDKGGDKEKDKDKEKSKDKDSKDHKERFLTKTRARFAVLCFVDVHLSVHMFI